MLNQMDALEAEQNHIDKRAGVVERKLRSLLETGTYFIARYATMAVFTPKVATTSFVQNGVTLDPQVLTLDSH